MKRFPLLFCFVSSLLLASCNGMPQLFWPAEDGKPAYARGKSGNPQAEGRMPLDVPPDLQDEISVPASEHVTAGAGIKDKAAVAGKAVSLDARIYDAGAGHVFSAVVDAMTALNMPVQSVDSPSGTVTTEWIRSDSSKLNPYIADVLGMFGAGPSYTRYRFVVRVLRMDRGGSRVEVRTLGQQYINRHWVNKALKRSVAEKIFSAVEEQLARRVPKRAEQGTAIKP